MKILINQAYMLISWESAVRILTLKKRHNNVIKTFISPKWFLKVGGKKREKLSELKPNKSIIILNIYKL
jgi:hypothetical protein